MQNQSSSTSQPDGVSAAPPRPLCLRILRLLATAALSFAVSILLAIVLLAKVPPLREVIFAFSAPQSDLPLYFTLLALFVVFTAPLAVMVYGLRRGWLSCRLQAAIWLLVVGVTVDLAMDDPVVNLPATLDELAPAMPGDEASYKVISRYSYPVKAPTFKLDPKIDQLVAKLNGGNTDTVILRENRDGIEAGWSEIAVLRDWFAELSAFPRIGDLLTKVSDPIPPFSPIRTYSRYACAHAQLLALEGKGDEALALLGQLMDVSEKMSSTSRTLVRIMISNVIEKMVLTRAGYVLDNATTSPAARAQFAAILSKGITDEAGARRMILVEYVAFMVPSFSNIRLGELVSEIAASGSMRARLLNWFDPLLVNPRATLNLAGDYCNRLADLAAKKDFAGMSVLGDKLALDWSGAVPIKNIGGRIMLSMAMPAYSKMTQQYWQEQDLLVALLARLKNMDAVK